MSHQQVAVGPMKNGLGATSLIFGIIALLFAPVTIFFIWTGIVAVFAYGVPIAGLAMGRYGVRRANGGIASNRGVSKAGVWTNGLGLALAVVMTVLWVAGFASTASS